MKYQGFLKVDKSISNGDKKHNEMALDISCPWGTELYAPFEEGSLQPITWKVIRANKVDTDAFNVIYSAIQRADGKDNITFAYFHTDKCRYKVGDIIKSGSVLCQTAPNGKFSAGHVHLSPRRNGMATKVGPTRVIVIKPGGTKGLGIVAGVPRLINVKNMKLVAGTKIQVITSLNVRKSPSTKAVAVGQLAPNTKTTIISAAPQYVVADGYEWAPTEKGWIAVQVMTSGETYVKILELPVSPQDEVKRLRSELDKAYEVIRNEQASVKMLNEKINSIRKLVN